LWSQIEPSLMWFPFLRMRSLHLGQVPMIISSVPVGHAML
jgi:hypothetical protein